MVRCEYCKKKSTEWRELTFHVFPKDEKQKLKWVENMGRKDWTPKKHMYLCSEHFTKNCIDFRDVQSRLRKGSIPTIFNHNKENAIVKNEKNGFTSEAEDIRRSNLRFLEDYSCTPQFVPNEPSETVHPIFIGVKDNDSSIRDCHPVAMIQSDPTANERVQDITEDSWVRNCHPDAEELDPETAKQLQEKILTHDHTYPMSSDVMKRKLDTALTLVEKLSAENKNLKKKAKRDSKIIKSLKECVKYMHKNKRLSRNNIVNIMGRGRQMIPYTVKVSISKQCQNDKYN